MNKPLVMPRNLAELEALICQVAGLPASAGIETASRRTMGLPDNASDEQLRDALLEAMGIDFDTYDSVEDDAVEVALNHAMQVTGHLEVLNPGECPAFDAAFEEMYVPAFMLILCDRMIEKEEQRGRLS